MHCTRVRTQHKTSFLLQWKESSVVGASDSDWCFVSMGNARNDKVANILQSCKHNIFEDSVGKNIHPMQVNVWYKYVAHCSMYWFSCLFFANWGWHVPSALFRTGFEHVELSFESHITSFVFMLACTGFVASLWHGLSAYRQHLLVYDMLTQESRSTC
jgi:hypothetical protein